MAFLALGCSEKTSPPTATLQAATPSSPAEKATVTAAIPTATQESPKGISTPLVVTARPTPVLPTATSIPLLPPLPQVSGNNSCPGTRLSMLMPGRRGRVSNVSAAANRLRSQPSTQATQVGEIPAGMYFDVLSGPTCADGMAWFEVRSETGAQGWMAEGSAEEYWVMPILSDAREVSGPEITLPGFKLNLPVEVGSKMQIIDMPFEPETRTPPVTIARLVDYPLPNHNSIIYVYPVEDYLYYRPEGGAALERIRTAINALVVNPIAKVKLANVVVSLSMSETYLPQAGMFNGGTGVRAIAMLAPSDGSGAPLPHYAFWGFSSDMKYLIFAALDIQLPFGQLAQATINDFQPRASLLDQIFGLKAIVPTSVVASRAELKACPGAPEIKLAVGDWARVSVDPPLSSRIRSMPGSSGQILGEVPAGGNLLILDGPQCANGYAWWKVRSLDGLEGWAAEGDTAAYWLVEPISGWYELPPPIRLGNTKTYDLRELRVSPETGLVSGVQGEYFPLATPMPTPETAETPWPDDPRANEFGAVYCAAHSGYQLSGAVDGFMEVFDIQDPLSRSYIGDCVETIRKILKNNTLYESYLQPFCGFNMGIPTHFKVNIKEIEFTGGTGLRFLISSANYLTVNKMNYRFQGLSEDGRYYISVLFYDIAHPYIVDEELWQHDFGPFVAWREWQYDKAEQSFNVFNGRMKELLEAGVVPLYPSLEVLDAMMASIVIK
jgi:uncharacterized protein YraI